MSASTVKVSSSRTTTPIRAITSPLSTRSAPSVPVASQIYDPLVKSVLRHRLINNIFLYSALISWLLTSVNVVWSNGGFGVLGFSGVLVTPIRPIVLLVSFADWAVAALPLIVLRKVYLTATRTDATSPSEILKTALAKRRTFHSFAVYSTSAVLTTFIYTIATHSDHSSVYGNPQLTIFVKSKKHPYYLNGRFLFLLCSQMTLAFLFLLRNVLLDRFVFRFRASLSSTRKWPFSAADFLATSVTILILASIALPCSAATFTWARITLPLVYRIPILPLLLRPFTAHFLRGPWTISLPLRHLSLLVKAWSLGIVTLTSWESSELLFEGFVAQPVTIAFHTADPALTLISGITTSDVTFKYFAYLELKDLAISESPSASSRRTALFGDQKYTPSLWSQLLRECLLHLGHSYQIFLRRGKASAPAAAAAVVPLNPPSTIIATPAPLLKKPIYQPTSQSPVRRVLDSFAADGSFSQAVDEGANAVHIPELFRSVEAIVHPVTAVVPTAVNSAQKTKGTLDSVKEWGWGVGAGFVGRYAPAWLVEAGGRWREWWGRERVSKVVQACLPMRDVDVLVIDALSHLTCASLTEDRYGVVQRDIPKILEAFLSFLSVIEEYQLEIGALYNPPLSDEVLSQKDFETREVIRIEVEKAGETLSFVGDALKEAVSRIVSTFGDRLLAYKFPPKTASKLQGFVDYC